MPVCASCGIRAKPELFDTAPLPAPTAPPPPSQSHATGITCPRCTFENHPALAFCELCHAPLVASNLPPQLAPGVNGAAASAHRELTLSGDVVKLSFRQGGSQDMYTRLRKAIMAHEWDQVASTATSSAETSARSTPLPEVQSRVGIHGLELRSRDVVRNNETTLSVAMQDLNGLMQSAQQMVVLAESFAERLSAGIAVGDGDVPQADAEARALLSQSSRVLGLTMPAVTKEASAGGRGEVVYLSELCRQIGGYLLDTGLLKREGGIMTLVDLWAVYNRARGVGMYMACFSVSDRDRSHITTRPPAGMSEVRRAQNAFTVTHLSVGRAGSAAVEPYRTVRHSHDFHEHKAICRRLHHGGAVRLRTRMLD